jgi:hypothetical protein
MSRERDGAGPSDAHAGSTSEELYLPGEGHAASSTMLREDGRHASDGILTRPVTLPFRQNGTPRDGYRSGGHHPAHGHVMGFQGHAA